MYYSLSVTSLCLNFSFDFFCMFPLVEYFILLPLNIICFKLTLADTNLDFHEKM